jgi:hypothetical protein
MLGAGYGVQKGDDRRNAPQWARCADAVEKVGFEVVAVAEASDRENTDDGCVASGC